MSTSILAWKTELPLVGTRAYVLGADLFRAFELGAVELFDERERPACVRSFKLHREIARDGTWRAGAQSGEVSGEIDWIDAFGGVHHAAFVEDGEPITRRVADYAPRLVAHHADEKFGGTALITPPARASELLFALVEGNKANHIATLKARGAKHDKIRLIYVEDLPWLAEPAPREVSLAYRCLGSRPASDRVYTLTSIATSLASAPVKICYSYAT